MVFLFPRKTFSMSKRRNLKRKSRNATLLRRSSRGKLAPTTRRGGGAGQRRHRTATTAAPPTDPRRHVSKPSIIPPTTGEPILENAARPGEQTRPLRLIVMGRRLLTTAPRWHASGCAQEQPVFPMMRLNRAGPWRLPLPGANRELWMKPRGDVIRFSSTSDLFGDGRFLAAHATALERHWRQSGNKLCFTYARVINTSNFADPSSEPTAQRITPWAIRTRTMWPSTATCWSRSGCFDTGLRLLWLGDLEKKPLGVNGCRRMGRGVVRAPHAPAINWHPALSLGAGFRSGCAWSRERARMGLVFVRETTHPSVRFIIQFTWLASACSGKLAHRGWPAQ